MSPAFRANFAPALKRTPLSFVAAGLLCLVPPALAFQEAAEAPPVVRISDTSRMDSEVVELLERYAKLAEDDPTNASVRADLGMAYEANNMWAEAELCYAHAAQLDPSEAQWRYRLGVAQRRNGKLDKALATLDQVTQEITRTESIWVRYAEMLMEAGRIDDAKAAYERAIAAGEERAAKEKEEGIQGPRFYHAYLGLGRTYIMTGEPEKALEQLNKALAIVPTQKSVHFALGQAHQMLGNEEQAAHHFALGQNAFRDYPPDPHTMKIATLAAGYGRRMGRIENMLATGDPAQIDGAIGQLTSQLAQRPDDHFVLNLLAKGYMAKGQLDKAEQYLLKSAEVNENAYETYIQLTTLLLNKRGALAQSQDPAAMQQAASMYTQALEYADKAIAAAPQLGRPYYMKGMALIQSQDPQQQQQALALFNEAVNRGCTEAQMYFMLSQMYYQMQNARESLKYAKLARDQMPDNPMLHLLCVQAYAGLGKWDEATKALEGAKRVAPDHPQVIGMEQSLKQSIQAAQQQQQR